ncbi:MAG: ribosome maturation factor RimM [Caulobacterales bacterium]
MTNRDRPARPDLVFVGAVLGAFGVRGEVRVRAFTAVPDALTAYGPLLDQSGAVVITPKRSRAIKDGLAITGPEIKDRDAAEALKGSGLYVPRSALPPVDDDEFYYVDLLGCQVESLTGEVLGVVKAVQDFGAGDLLEIAKPEGGNWFLAFTKEAVPVVDLPARRLVSTQKEPRVSKDDQPEADD